MTAEVGVINRRGIALAADSAVTINDSKVTNSAVKLFTLDSAHYVGIMFFGNANLQDIPWEVIIKSYREKIGNKTFDKLQDYVDDFKTYVSLLPVWNSLKSQWSMMHKYALTIVNTLNSFVKGGKTMDQAILTAVQLISAERSLNVDRDKLINNFKVKISNQFKNSFANITDTQCDKCVKLTIDLLMSNFTPDDYTGVVFAGYGKAEMFPAIYKLQVDGVVDGKIRISNTDVTSCDPLRDDDAGASIVTFAQSDVMRTVIYGIAPELNKYREKQLESLETTIAKCFPKDQQRQVKTLFNNHNQAFARHFMQEYVSPITSMLGTLSISELGSMAEMLVNLTAFKRKFTNDIGTVGGPIDVLTISRGEGPIWIKRKEYFNKDLNEGYRLRRK